MFNLNKPKSLLLVAIMLVAAVGGAMAAAPVVNTETTDTTYTSDLTDGGTQAYNATTSTNFSWSADSANSKIVIEQGNDTLYTATPQNPEGVDTDTSGTNDTWYFNTTLANDGSDYSGLDADAGESVTLNVTLINNTEATNPDTTNVSYTFANGNEVAFEDVEGDNVETPGEAGYLASLFSSDDETDAAKTDSTVGIAGNETKTVTMSVAGTTLGDALDASAEETDEGDIMWSSTTGLEGDYILIANEEAPDKDWFDDSSTYATYDSGAQTLTYHNVNERVDEDAKDVELSATGNDGLGLRNTASMLTSYDASTTEAYLAAVTNADWSEPEWEDSDE